MWGRIWTLGVGKRKLFVLRLVASFVSPGGVERKLISEVLSGGKLLLQIHLMTSFSSEILCRRRHAESFSVTRRCGSFSEQIEEMLLGWSETAVTAAEEKN